MKEFHVLATCAVCGETFDTDYKLTKHVSKSHPPAEMTGRVGGEDEHACSCGHAHHHD